MIKNYSASALIYTLIVLVIITVIISSLIMYFHYENLYYQRMVMQNRMQDNVISGFDLVGENPDIVSYGQSIEFNLYDDPLDVIHISREQWGLFDLVSIFASHQNDTVMKSALMGDFLARNDSLALYLPGKGYPLKICGDSRVEGFCYLPKSGIRGVSVEGRYYSNDTILHGISQISEQQLPQFTKELKVQQFIDDVFSSSTSAEEYNVSDPNSSKLTNEYHQPIKILYSSESICIENVEMKGKILLVSDQSVLIRNTAKLNGIIVYAPQIEIESGFTGSLQVFCKHLISIQENVTLEYPSLLYCSNPNQDEEYVINIGSQSLIAGAVIATASEKGVFMDTDSHVYGQVYSNGNFYHKGSVYGQVYCDLLYYQSLSSIYKNLMMDSEINRSFLPPEYVGIELVNNSETYYLMQWL
ncbi:MAG: hypothetical protein JEZ03_06395 [Bacteroidales bacterium]|nr:hypothetical protein [Bacteroidales bacterium]